MFELDEYGVRRRGSDVFAGVTLRRQPYCFASGQVDDGFIVGDK